MESFNLLLVLPDAENKRVLVCENGKHLPAYAEPVGENVGFDEPQMYNDYFEQITGVPVFRRYTFNTQKTVVFVFERKNYDNVHIKNGCEWVLYDDFANACDDTDVLEIVRNVENYYNKSENMPWVKMGGFAPYMDWLKGVCDKNDICIMGDITQLKNAYVSTVFCVPTNMGNVYMKIPGKTFITELRFTQGLRGLNIADLPNWIDWDVDMNVFLMRDMGGNDLPNQSDVSTLRDAILHYASIQKASVRHIPLNFEHYDNTIPAILCKLKTYVAKTHEILQGTPHALTMEEIRKLEKQTKIATAMLESIMHISLPNTVHNGDVRPGNIRVVDGRYLFYDWAWGAVSHPFIEIVSFMHIIRRTLPNETAREALIDCYIHQWLDYGSYDGLKHAFSVLVMLKDLFFAIVDYDWVEAINQSKTEPTSHMSADGWLLERRIYYFANVLRRFINTAF